MNGSTDILQFRSRFAPVEPPAWDPYRQPYAEPSPQARFLAEIYPLVDDFLHEHEQRIAQELAALLPMEIERALYVSTFDRGAPRITVQLETRRGSVEAICTAAAATADWDAWKTAAAAYAGYKVIKDLSQVPDTWRRVDRAIKAVVGGVRDTVSRDAIIRLGLPRSGYRRGPIPHVPRVVEAETVAKPIASAENPGAGPSDASKPADSDKPTRDRQADV